MKKAILTILLITIGSIYGLKAQQVPSFDWAFEIDPFAENGQCISKYLDSDNEGNVVLVGELWGPPSGQTVDFNPLGTTEYESYEGSSPRAFMAKYDPDGYLIWAKIASEKLEVNELIVLDNNSFVISGRFFGEKDFQFGDGEYLVNPNSEVTEAYVAKYDSNGQVEWVEYTSGAESSIYTSMTIDQNGSILQYGYFEGVSADFNPNGSPLILSPEGSRDHYIKKISANGSDVSVIQLYTTHNIFINDLIVDQNDGSIYYSGPFYQTQDLNPELNNEEFFDTEEEETYYSNIYVVKLNALGEYQWAGANSESLINIHLTNDGNLMILGSFAGELDVDPSEEEFIVETDFYSRSFILQWTNEGAFFDINVLYPYDTGSIASFVTVSGNVQDSDGSFYISGSLRGGMDFNGEIEGGSIESTNPSVDKVYMAKYDENLNFVWARRITGNSIYDDAIYSRNKLTLDSDKNIFIGGAYENTLLFPGLNISDGNVANGIVVAKFNQCDWITTTEVSSCDSYDWAGNTYTISGQYENTLISSLGCDSTVTLNLTVNSSQESEVDTTGCNDFFWNVNGTTYVESGVYSETLVTTAGCDSIVTLNLALLQDEVSEEVSTCDSLLWDVNGQTYFESGFYQEVYTNSAGCYSTRILDLDILQSSESEMSESSCESYFWTLNDTEYSESGSYTTIISNTVGCDSTITLELDILDPTESEIFEEVCSEFTWELDGNTYSETGVYQTILENAAECDSIVSLNLTLLEESSTEDVSSCFSYEWDINGTTYEESGVFSETFTNIHGCDSIRELNLEILEVDTSVEVNNNTLTSNAPNADYQWLDCDNDFEPIDGANAAEFTPTENGSYAVSVNQEGCQDTSSCYLITSVGILESTHTSDIGLFPNPTSGDFYLDVSKSQIDIDKVSCYSTMGRLLFSINFKNPEAPIKLPDANGVYYIRVMSESQIIETFRVVKID